MEIIAHWPRNSVSSTKSENGRTECLQVVVLKSSAPQILHNTYDRVSKGHLRITKKVKKFQE